MKYDNDEYIATYVCRMCGMKIRGGITSSKDIIDFNMACYCATGDFEDLMLSKYNRHRCENGNIGVGDFIGFTRGDNYNGEEFND